MAVSLKKLDQEIEKLEELPYEELLPKWIKQFGCNPPKGVKQPLLARAAVYHLQDKRFGSLKRETHKALLSIANGANHKPSAQKIELKPGMRLRREWHGKTHQVEVLEKGFEWQGEAYTSLSAIAKAITGAKCSGPRFFGILGGQEQ